MNDVHENRAGFSLADIRALRWLAITLGIILSAMSLVARDQREILVAAALIVLMMITSPLAIYLLRKHKARKRDGA